MMLRIYKELHQKEPYKNILETIQTCLDSSTNNIAIKMKTLIDNEVNAIPEEEVVKEIANITQKGE